MSDSLRPYGLQHSRLPCPSPTPGAYSNSCPLGWWCLPTISSSVVPFSSRLQSFPASGSFLVNQFFASGGQSIQLLSWECRKIIFIDVNGVYTLCAKLTVNILYYILTANLVKSLEQSYLVPFMYTHTQLTLEQLRVWSRLCTVENLCVILQSDYHIYSFTSSDSINTGSVGCVCIYFKRSSCKWTHTF